MLIGILAVAALAAPAAVLVIRELIRERRTAAAFDAIVAANYGPDERADS